MMSVFEVFWATSSSSHTVATDIAMSRGAS
jgi:hypothetical protein